MAHQAHLVRRAALAMGVAAALLAASCSSGEEDASPPVEASTELLACPVDALDETDGPVEIDLWHADIGMPSEAIDRLAAGYNASQDRVVVRPQFQGTVPELMRKFSDSIGDPGSLPTVLSTDETALQFMADSGVAVPASACLAVDPSAQPLFDDLLPAVRSANTIDGVLWPAAPTGMSAVMYSNDAHLRAAGLDPASPPATLEEVRDAAEAIRDAGVPGVDAPVVMRVDSWLSEYWTTGAGQALVDQDNGHAALATESRYDNPATIELLDWIDEMVDDGLLKLTDNADLVAAFLAVGNGSSSILFDSSAAISTVNAVVSGSVTPQQSGLGDGELPGAAALQGLDVSVSPLPGLTPDASGQVLGGGWYLVDDGDPARVAAAWDFLKYFLGTEQQVTWAIDSSYLPVQQTAADSPRLRAFWSDTEPGRWMATAYRSFASLDADFPGPIIGPYAEFRLEVIRALESLADGTSSVEAAVDEVSVRFGEQLQAYRDEVGA